MAQFNVGGLVSGLDTNKILSQLSDAARIPKKTLDAKKSLLNLKLDAWKTLSLKLVSLRLDEVSLNQALSTGSRLVSNSDETLFTASVTGVPSVGTRTLKIIKLAQSEENLSQGVRAVDSKIVGTGTLQLTSGINADDHDVNEFTKLSYLNNGSGVNLSSIQITDRAGHIATIDLSFSETLQDVMDAISGNTTVQVTAKINKNGTGITIQDDTGSSNGPLKIAESGGSSAVDLGILTSTSGVVANEVVGKDLKPRYAITINSTNNTLVGIRDAISELKGPFVATIINDGSSIAPYRLSVVNKNTGSISQIAFNSTVDQITNELVGNGDGSSGSQLGEYSLAVAPLNDVSDISSLSVAGTFYTARATGGNTGTGHEVEVDVNTGNIQFFEDGVASQVTGEIRATYTPAGLTFSEIQTAQDAEIQMGTVNPITVKNHTNTLSDTISGLKIDLLKADSGKTLTLTVANDTASMTDAVSKMVDNYNTIVSFIGTQNTFDKEKKDIGGALFGDITLVTVLTELQRSITGAVPGLPSNANSLFQFGFKPGSDGTLQMDKAEFAKNLTNNFEAVQKVFLNNKNIASTAIVTANSAAGYNPSALVDGNASSEGFGPGQGWQDNTPHVFPDDVTLKFPTAKYLNKVVINTLDSQSQPASANGIRDYDLQYLKLGGNATKDADWITITSVTNNNKGKMTHTFNAFTERIRVRIKGTNSADGISKLTEIETYEDNSVGARIKNSVTKFTDSKVGTIFFKQDAIRNSVTGLDSQMKSIEDRVLKQEAILAQKFAAMESALAKLQSAGNFFNSQIASNKQQSQ